MNRWLLPPVIVYIVAVTCWLSVIGVHPTYDSVVYLSGGESIAHGLGYVVENHYARTGRCYTHRYPPGFSTVIAGGVVLGLSREASATAINVAAGLAAVALLYALLLQTGIPAIGAACLSCGYAVNPYVLRCIAHLWSEPVAIALMLAVLLLLPQRPWLSGVLAGIALTVRNAMAALCVALGVYYLWQRRWRDVGLCVIGGLMGCGWLLVCNYLNWGTIQPYYSSRPSDQTVYDCVFRTMYFGAWYLSPLGILLAFVRLRRLPAGVAAVVTVYAVMLLRSELTYHISPINYRLLSPLFSLLLVAMATRWEHKWMQVFIAVWPVWAFAQFAAVLI